MIQKAQLNVFCIEHFRNNMILYSEKFKHLRSALAWRGRPSRLGSHRRTTTQSEQASHRPHQQRHQIESALCEEAGQARLPRRTEQGIVETLVTEARSIFEYSSYGSFPSRTHSSIRPLWSPRCCRSPASRAAARRLVVDPFSASESATVS